MATWIVERNFVESSKSFSMTFAFLLPSSARLRMRFLLTDTTAISAPAKKAFMRVKNKSNNKLEMIEVPVGSASIRLIPPKKVILKIIT